VSRVAARTSRYWQPTDAANGPELSAIFRAAEQLASTDHHVIHRVIRQNLEARGVFDGYEVGTDVDGVSFYQPAGDPMTAFQHRADRIELTDRYQKVAIGEVLDRIHGLHQQISEEYRGDNFDTVHGLDPRSTDAARHRRSPPGLHPGGPPARPWRSSGRRRPRGIPAAAEELRERRAAEDALIGTEQPPYDGYSAADTGGIATYRDAAPTETDQMPETDEAHALRLAALEQEWADAHADGGTCGIAICDNDDCQTEVYERQLIQQTREHEDELRRRAELEGAYSALTATSRDPLAAPARIYTAEGVAQLNKLYGGEGSGKARDATDDPAAETAGLGPGRTAGDDEMAMPHEEGLDRGHGPDIGLSP
jgi:hypothetical protein